MRYLRVLLLVMFMLPFAFNSNNVLAQNGDDNNWTEYRFNSHNNPVLETDAFENIKQTIGTENEIRSTPVVVGDRVFVGNHNSGKLYAYNLNTGELIWQNEAPNWVHSEMIYVNDQLFVGYGNRFFQDNGIRGTGESGLLSLNPDNGEILWDFDTRGEVMPTPAFYDDTVYITTGDKHLYGLDPETGTERWSLNLGSVVSMSSPNIKDGVLYVGGSSPYTFFAVDLDDREIKWERHFENVTSGLDDVPPVVSNEGVVYTTAVQETENPLSIRQIVNTDGAIAAYKQVIKLAVGDLIGKQPIMNHEHKIYAMASDNGELEWQKSLGEGQMVSNNKSGAPMLYDDKVFVGSPITKSFYAFDARDGEQLWNHSSNINKAPPVADNNVVYFTDTKGLVYGFNTDSGELQGKKLLGGTLAPSGPLLVNNHLIVGSQDTNVYSVPTEEILEANDSVEEENSLLSYVLFIYMLPIAGLMAAVMIGVFIVKRWWKN